MTATATAVRLAGVDFAASDPRAMSAFYGTMFGTELIELDMGDEVGFMADIGGVRFLFVSLAAAEIDTDGFRHQLNFEVEDIHAVYAAGLAAGGTGDCPPEGDDARYACIRDLDANPVVLRAS